MYKVLITLNSKVEKYFHSHGLDGLIKEGSPFKKSEDWEMFDFNSVGERISFLQGLDFFQNHKKFNKFHILTHLQNFN